jgi:D-lactate dehydrogenase
MRVMVYSSHAYETPFLEAAKGNHEMIFTSRRLTAETASLAAGCQAVAIFTSDDADATVLDKLYLCGVRYVALRSAGFDHVDLAKAKSLGMRVANVPEYSPYSVAEHAVTLLMALNRKLTESRLLMQLQDYRLDTLTGFDVHGKTVGIIGTGKIGMAFARIMNGYGAHLLAFDPVINPDATNLGIRYVLFEKLLQQSDIISIHCPLNEHTKYLFSEDAFANIKSGCFLINTARGGIIQTSALIQALEAGKLGGACLDVYEQEKAIFMQDLRQSVIKDPLYVRLRSLKNVIITGHQGFLTREALTGIAGTTMQNLDAWQQGHESPNTLVSG